MKCIYCGAEIKEGCIYCSKCGKEVQLVPDYNIIEDDYLKALLEEENRRNEDRKLAQSKEESESEEIIQNSDNKNGKSSKKKTIIIISVLIAICVVGIIAALIVHSQVKKNQESSVEYQMSMAEDALKSKDNDEAISYYEKALKLDKNNVEARLALGSIYKTEKKYDEAAIQYKEVLKVDENNKEAYKNLIAIYETQDDNDAIIELSQTTKDSGILDLFTDYIVSPPVFSVKEGKYDDYQEIELSTSGNFDIYYTIDGTDPVKYGKKYSEAVALDEMKVYELKAVCKNDKGIYSETTTGKFEIEIAAPDMPSVTPDGGDFGAKTSVTVNVPDGCKAYYTWDSTNPSSSSALYTAPIEVPEGNNILSVILIDEKTEQTSNIYRGNFIYITK